MATIQRVNKPVVQRLGNDSIYGEGVDGDVTIASNTTLGRDMYYRSLTVNSGVSLITNGFRVFVEKTLTNNGTIGLPAGLGGAVASGTLVGRVADAPGTKQYVLGESASGTQVPAAVLKDLKQAIQGWHFDPVDGIKKIEGGDDGTAGSDTSGAAGGAGGAGSHPNEPAGQPGTPGNPGSAGGTGSGGAKGVGGGLVVIVANVVAGTGTIVSEGSAGGSGTTGSAGAAGNAGPTQNANTYQDGSNPPGFVAGDASNTSYFAGNTPVTGDDASTSYGDAPSKSNSDAPSSGNPPTHGSDPPIPTAPICKEQYNPPNPPTQVQGNAHFHIAITGEDIQTPAHHNQPGDPGTSAGHACDDYPPHSHGDPPFVVTTGQPSSTGDPPTKADANVPSFFPGNPPHTGQPSSYTAGDVAGFQNQSNPNFASNVQYTGGTAGAGGAGGTGATGATGGEGGLLIVTEQALPDGMTPGSYATVVLNA